MRSRFPSILPTRADWLAFALSVAAVFVSFWVAERVFEQMPHLEDEMAYVWQAQVAAAGKLTLPSPPHANSFLVPFVVDYDGLRFGKYPPGWPVTLALGVAVGLRSWVNPLLAGLGVWLTYRLGKRVLSETVGLLAAGLTLVSPFFLINSGSLLSHPLGLVLAAAFALGWLDAFTAPELARRERLNPWLPTLAAGLCLGLLALTRPLTAVAVGLPFGLHGLYLLARGPGSVRRRLISLGLIALALGSLVLIWQYAVTGDALLNPYTLWWKYDTVGFGPGVGRNPAGHTLRQAWINTRHSLDSGYGDLFGWGQYSWIFLPFGLLVVLLKRSGRALLLGSVFASLLVIYLAYWIGSSLFGPRYYYEGLFSLTLFSAAGIAWLAGWPITHCDERSEGTGSPRLEEGLKPSLRERFGRVQAALRRGQKARAALVSLALAGLVGYNLAVYLPSRLDEMYGLYDIQRARMAPFQTAEAQALAPALVIVHPQKRWTDYGTLLELSDPFLDTPFIFVISRGPEQDTAVAELFPERKTVHYYADEPFKLYTGLRGE